ncbi:MAG: transposase [Planctomycetota bacterium]
MPVERCQVNPPSVFSRFFATKRDLARRKYGPHFSWRTASMARRPRCDDPDTFHHGFNRGVSKRTIFETREDCRYFLSLVLREVRAKRIELIAYCLMTTHFHLLVRSVTGELSVAMKRIQNRYARYFNRTRKRDGPLFRGRYKSRPVDSQRYLRTVIAYIHDNPVAAGIAERRSAASWSSARRWKDGEPPRWLRRVEIDAWVEATPADWSFDDRMDEAFPGSLDEEHVRWVERQMRGRHDDELEEVALKHAATPRVVAWTIRKARLADGTRPWRPVCPAGVVEDVLERSKRLRRELSRLFPRNLRRALSLLKAGLLRSLSGCSHREIAMRTNRHRGTVSHDVADHYARFESNFAYAALTSRLMRRALADVGV